MTNSAYAHLRNTVLRGGRLTKFKGIAAIIAPMLGTAVVFVGLSGGAAQATCTPVATAGNDTITCTGVVGGTFSAGIGNDVVTVRAGATTNNLNLGAGADILDVSGTIVGIVYTESIVASSSSPNLDTIIIRDGGGIIRGVPTNARSGLYVTGLIDLTVERGGTIDNTSQSPGPASDAVYFVNAATTNVIQIIKNDGTIAGLRAGIADAANGGAGTRSFRITNTGSISGATDFGIRANYLGADIIINDGGVITGSRGSMSLALGNDTVQNLNGGQLNGDVYLGDGDDTLTNSEASSIVGNIFAGYGDDQFNWSGTSTFAGDYFGDRGLDRVNISSSGYDGSQFFDGGDGLTGVSGWIDELTIFGITASTAGANLLNWEILNVDGGSLVITGGALSVGRAAGMGLTISGGGTVDAGGAFALTGNLTTSAGGVFDGTGGGTGVYTIFGSVLNDGIITTLDGMVGDVITIAGDYAGTGLLLLDVNTTTDTADVLNVAVDVTGGATTIVVNNLSPLVATGNDITVVTVGGTASASDFVLQGGSVTAGAFDYTLGQSGSNFVLAAAVNSTGAVYEAAPSVLGAFNRLPTLEQRVGQRQWTGQSGAQTAGQPITGAWVRFTGDKLDATTTAGSSIASKTWGLQTGADFAVEPGDAGQWVLGITGQYGKVSSTVTSALGFGTIDAEGFGVGATATWYGNTGTYVDLQGQMNWIDSDIASSAAGSLVKGQSAKAYALSAEVGHRFALNETSALVPQAQLTWGRIDGGSFTDSAGNVVDLGSNGRTIGRLGLAYEYAPKTAAGGNPTKAYVIGNILHDFSGDSSVKVGGASLSTGAAEKTWGEIGVGGSYAFDANKTLYGEAAYRTSFGGSSNNNGLSATVGLRIQW